jgi:hypothetical protein
MCKRSREVVVLKVYNMGSTCELYQHQIYREVSLHSSLQHENIITLYAAFQVRGRLGGMLRQEEGQGRAGGGTQRQEEGQGRGRRIGLNAGGGADITTQDKARRETATLHPSTSLEVND